MQLDKAIRITRRAANDARDMAVRQERAGLHDYARSNAEKARALEMVCKAAEISRGAVNVLKFPPNLAGDEQNGVGKGKHITGAANASEGQINAK